MSFVCKVVGFKMCFFVADVSAKNVVSRAVWRGVVWVGAYGGREKGKTGNRGAVCDTRCARYQRVLRA